MRANPCVLSCLGWIAGWAGLSLPAAAQCSPGAPAEGAPAVCDEIVRVSGSVRSRYETVSDPFVAGRSGHDALLGLRTLLRLEANSGPFRLVGEILDSRFIAGEKAGGSAGEVDTLEPVQLYAEVVTPLAPATGARVALRGGRFAMDVGSRRLIARANFRSIIQSFDGVRAVIEPGGGAQLEAFGVFPTTRSPSDAASLLGNETALNPTLESVVFSGLHVTAPLKERVAAEIYAFNLTERDTAEAPSRNRALLTLGARLHSLPARGQLDVDLEYAHQTGAQRATRSPADATDLDHDASMIHLEAGYTFDAPGRPRISLHYDFASGDTSPGDTKSGRFDTLFGDRAFELGPTSLWGAISRSNLSSPGIRLEAEPDVRSDVMVMLRDVELASARDSFANSQVSDPSGASGADVGRQIEVRYRRWLIDDVLRLSAGGAWLQKGEFLRDAPNSPGRDDARYAYTELSWSF